jgi:CheY-like chemotaxis protein
MDDEKTVRTVLTAILENLGYTVTCVETGEEAITVYRAALDREEPFAACIMDLTVPGAMGGREALEHLRETDPDVRAVVSSGYSNDPVMAHYEEHGFCDVMTKPYRLQDVGRVMRRATMQGVAPAARQDLD